MSILSIRSHSSNRVIQYSLTGESKTDTGVGMVMIFPVNYSHRNNDTHIWWQGNRLCFALHRLFSTTHVGESV